MKRQKMFLLILAGWMALSLHPKLLPAADQPARIQLAILLDTSGSMDGLIDQAKSRLWKIVNELATARKNGLAPRLQVALYEYGQDSIPAAAGYLRRIMSLSDDLDRISEQLFKLKTNGGQEYCGLVIQSAVRDLEWSRRNGDLKMIVIAGNEPFSQGAIDYKNSCREAIARGIMVNTIFCGNYQEGLQTGWKAGADLADGQYLAIDANHTPPPITAPQDKEIARLSQEMNQTYLAYGREGASGKERQKEQDKNAASLSSEVAAQRAAAKAAPQYSNSAWDLVDAKKTGQVKLEEMAEAELPEEMKGLTVKERNEFVSALQGKREALQKKIARLHDERQRFVEDKLKNQSAAGTLDAAIIRALRLQAKAKNFSFDK
ncbi:MAG: VWA domain-containing protein [Candidatus Aminicenantes bacterium]|nr:VWA domain-containing protein [Candidatus Aminicenantes bacterium]